MLISPSTAKAAALAYLTQRSVIHKLQPQTSAFSQMTTSAPNHDVTILQVTTLVMPASGCCSNNSWKQLGQRAKMCRYEYDVCLMCSMCYAFVEIAGGLRCPGGERMYLDSVSAIRAKHICLKL